MEFIFLICIIKVFNFDFHTGHQFWISSDSERLENFDFLKQIIKDMRYILCFVTMTLICFVFVICWCYIEALVSFSKKIWLISCFNNQIKLYIFFKFWKFVVNTLKFVTTFHRKNPDFCTNIFFKFWKFVLSTLNFVTTFHETQIILQDLNMFMPPFLSKQKKRKKCERKYMSVMYAIQNHGNLT